MKENWSLNPGDGPNSEVVRENLEEIENTVDYMNTDEELARIDRNIGYLRYIQESRGSVNPEQLRALREKEAHIRLKAGFEVLGCLVCTSFISGGVVTVVNPVAFPLALTYCFVLTSVILLLFFVTAYVINESDL